MLRRLPPSQALRANPTQMSFSDLQAALPTGAVDGQENPLSLFQAAKFHQLNQKFVTAWGYVNDPVLFAISKDAWSKFSSDDQRLVRAADERAARELVDQVRKSSAGADSPVARQIGETGVQITWLTAPEFAAFRDATRPVYAKWSKTIGADLIARAEAAIAKR